MVRFNRYTEQQGWILQEFAFSLCACLCFLQQVNWCSVWATGADVSTSCCLCLCVSPVISPPPVRCTVLYIPSCCLTSGGYDASADAVHAHSSDCSLPPVFSDNHKTLMGFKRKPLCNFHSESNLLRITVFALWFPFSARCTASRRSVSAREALMTQQLSLCV